MCNLGVYTYNFINLNREYINKESAISNDCLNLNFEIISAKYSGSSLMVLVKNKPSGTRISRINIKEENTTLSKETDIPSLGQKEIIFENFREDITDASTPASALIFPNSCESYAKTVYLQN